MIAGILPGDGEVVPLTFGFGSDQSLADATWTLAWDSSKIRLSTPVFDENGEFVDYFA